MKLKFIPLNYSWVALHPEPVGVIHFIGGAFFGTFPTAFYRDLLSQLFAHNYTIVAIPYRFTFRHWSVATGLARDLVTLRRAMRAEAKFLGYDDHLYDESQPDIKSKYFWLGHSLGCKYIALLELLADLEVSNNSTQAITLDRFEQCIPPAEQQRLKTALSNVDLSMISIENQRSVLMAPAIEGIESAIPFLRNPRFSGVKNLLNGLGIRVEPTQAETFCLIEQSDLFNLTSLISFDRDTRIAAPTVRWLRENLGSRLQNYAQLSGKHLSPLGFANGDRQIPTKVLEFFQ